MSPVTYEPIRLSQSNRYAGYQFHSRVRVNGLSPSDAFRFLILTVCSWARQRMPEEDRNVPELSLPEAEAYASVSDEAFVPYHISIGYALDITPLMEQGIWSLRLKEPDGGIEGVREPVPQRFFTTRVGLRLNEKGYTELGIRIDVTDPASEEKEVDFAFRPAFVRSLAIQPSVVFEHVREMKHGHAAMVNTDEEYRQLMYMLENEENQLPVVVFTHFRREEKKKVKTSIEDFVKSDPLKSFLYSSGMSMGFPGVSGKTLEFTLPVMPETGPRKMPATPPKTVRVPSSVPVSAPGSRSSAAVPESAAEEPVMLFDTTAFSKSAFAYALTFVLGDKYLEKFRNRMKKEFEPGDILVCGCRKFRGGITVIAFPGETEYELKKAYNAALLAAQSYSKHKTPYEFGSVVFETEARKMEQHARVMELVNSSSMEDRDRIARMTGEMQMLLDVIDDKDENIEELKRQKDEAFRRGQDFGEKENAALEEENSRLRKDLTEKQDRIDMMEGRYQEAREVLNALDELRAVSEMPETKEDVVQYFHRIYRDRIDFTDRGLNTAAKCELKPASLWEVLYAVSNGLVDLFRNSTGNLTEKDVQEATGYRASFGEGSMTRENAGMMRQREDLYEGKVISVEPHLKLRNGKEEKENQRLHFWYDPERRRVVISYLGEHLDSVSGRRKS